MAEHAHALAEEAAHVRVAIVTVSDSAARGVRADLGGPAVREAMLGAEIGATIVDERVVEDDQQALTEVLFHLTERSDVDLVLTTGGTGLSLRDVTPQATRSVVDYEVPGLAEAMRAASLRVTPAAMLSRAMSGVRKRTLIVNLPGNPKAVGETLAVILPALPHAVATLRGRVGQHDRPR